MLYNSFMNIKRIAFTLAEVLVTLMIVGIVASMTIPSLLQNMQEQQYKNAFKKTYSDMAQAATLMIGEGTFSSMCKEGAIFSDELELKFFKVLNRCGTGRNKTCFWTDTTPAFNYKSLSGNNVYAARFDDGQFIMANGQFVMLENQNNAPIVCVAWIDVDGYLKGPNTLGKDVFGVQFLADKIVPMGSSESTWPWSGGSQCTTTDISSSSGEGCAVKVILDEEY